MDTVFLAGWRASALPKSCRGPNETFIIEAELFLVSDELVNPRKEVRLIAKLKMLHWSKRSRLRDMHRYAPFLQRVAGWVYCELIDGVIYRGGSPLRAINIGPVMKALTKQAASLYEQ